MRNPTTTEGLSTINRKEYDNAWDDVEKAQSLGCKVQPEFLKDLRESLGKEK
jgi:hypothetical protein